MPPAYRDAVVAILVLCAYFAIDNHVSMPPWNNLDATGPQWRSTLTGVVPLLAGLAALMGRIRWLVAVVALWAVIWFAAQLQQWWLPYLFGPTPLHDDFSWFVDGGYADTLGVLPGRDARPTPDAQHLTLQILSLTTAVLLVRAVLTSERR